jgi:hypothetical protein
VPLKLRTVCEFFWLGFDPRVKADLLYGGDSGLYWRALLRTVRLLLENLGKKLGRGKEQTCEARFSR